MVFYRRLVIYRGLPACGKTTDALAYIAEDVTKRCRVNRDSLRVMLNGRWLGTGQQEDLVTLVQWYAVRTAFEYGGYTEVVVDDTNLPDKSVTEFQELAGRVGAQVEIRDLRGVPLDTCIARDALRLGNEHVGEATIRRMYDKHIAGVAGIPPVRVEPDTLAAPADLYAEGEFGDEMFLAVQATANELRTRLAAQFSGNLDAQRTASGVVDQWMREELAKQLEAAE